MNIDITQQRSESVFSLSPHFAANRFAAYFKLFSATNYRNFLLSAASIIIISFLFFIFNFYTSAHAYYQSDTITDYIWHSECSLMTFILAVLMMVGGSRCFNAISSRQDRASLLEIPASHIEKFLTWICFYLPILIATSLFCFYIADIMRVVWVKVFTDYGSYAKVIPFSNVLALTTKVSSRPEKVFEIVSTYCNLLLLNAIFTLGSSLFTRLAFIKTIFSLSVIGLLLIIAAYLGYNVFISGHYVQTIFDPSISETSTTLVYAGSTILISLYLYYISYMRLKESEIVTGW